METNVKSSSDATFAIAISDMDASTSFFADHAHQGLTSGVSGSIVCS